MSVAFSRTLSWLLLLVLVPVAGASATAQSKKKQGKSARRVRPAPPAWPTFEARHADWVRRKESAAATGRDGPAPLEQYLVSEITVTGVFDTDTGYGVFLHAAPTDNTFFAGPGAMLFNGRVSEIAGGSSGFNEDVQIVFVERAPKAGGPDRRVVKRVEPAPEPPAPAEPSATPATEPADAPGVLSC